MTTDSHHATDRSDQLSTTVLKPTGTVSTTALAAAARRAR